MSNSNATNIPHAINNNSQNAKSTRSNDLSKLQVHAQHQSYSVDCRKAAFDKTVNTSSGISYIVRVDGISDYNVNTLSETFGVVGNLKYVRIKVDLQGRHALLEYSTRDSAVKALKKFRNLFKLSLVYYLETDNFFLVRVDGILDNTEKEIYDLFSIVGNFKSLKIDKDTEGRFALLEYSTKESALKIIKKLNGTKMKYNGRKSDVFRMTLWNVVFEEKTDVNRDEEELFHLEKDVEDNSFGSIPSTIRSCKSDNNISLDISYEIDDDSTSIIHVHEKKNENYVELDNVGIVYNN